MPLIAEMLITLRNNQRKKKESKQKSSKKKDLNDDDQVVSREQMMDINEDEAYNDYPPGKSKHSFLLFSLSN